MDKTKKAVNAGRAKGATELTFREVVAKDVFAAMYSGVGNYGSTEARAARAVEAADALLAALRRGKEA